MAGPVPRSTGTCKRPPFTARAAPATRSGLDEDHSGGLGPKAVVIRVRPRGREGVRPRPALLSGAGEAVEGHVARHTGLLELPLHGLADVDPDVGGLEGLVL